MLSLDPLLAAVNLPAPSNLLSHDQLLEVVARHEVRVPRFLSHVSLTNLFKFFASLQNFILNRQLSKRIVGSE